MHKQPHQTEKYGEVLWILACTVLHLQSRPRVRHASLVLLPSTEGNETAYAIAIVGFEHRTSAHPVGRELKSGSSTPVGKKSLAPQAAPLSSLHRKRSKRNHKRIRRWGRRMSNASLRPQPAPGQLLPGQRRQHIASPLLYRQSLRHFPSVTELAPTQRT